MKKRLFITIAIFTVLLTVGVYCFLSVKHKHSPEIFDAVATLPAPPEPDSDEAKNDELMYRRGMALRNTKTLKDITILANIYKLDQLEHFFTDAIGITISSEKTPKLHAILEEVSFIAKRAAGKAKKKFGRARPFVIHPEDPTCLPNFKESAKPNTSYPSFHTASVWSVGLILSKIIPEKSDFILQQASRLSASRWQCGYHWFSDVEASKNMVNGIVERFLKEDDFRNRLSDAQKELLLQK
ncbi:MAG: phosphatase PAP2 family protein [Oxalobacter sp.]